MENSVVIQEGVDIINLNLLTNKNMCIIKPNKYWDQDNRVSMKCDKYYLAEKINDPHYGWKYKLYSHEKFDRQKHDNHISVGIGSGHRFHEYEIIGWKLIIDLNEKESLRLQPVIQIDHSCCKINLTSGTLDSYVSALDGSSIINLSETKNFMNEVHSRSLRLSGWSRLYSILHDKAKIGTIKASNTLSGVNIHRSRNDQFTKAGEFIEYPLSVIMTLEGPGFAVINKDVSEIEMEVLKSHPKIKNHIVDKTIGMDSTYFLLD